ncbi:acyl-CoA dehydrogenase [Cupriavidus sp. USMAA2-4]|uniref:Acyl-CoA dehydrogenase n=1 Tax=Cupriavidus malaysiensis TaxID=367825 RepID=A0ABM6F2N3_9BURK|nr:MULTISPECIES: acyl-CoA dehydrogenase [Cupriavidus]AOY91210.1 acyl-CoA dehydrogenase [Cupriavidus sp. USMAA2-4]AOZ05639.1 acyl-CoA dehydrogenase [Cupriavidus malaysiensis]
MFVEAIEAILKDQCTPAFVRKVEAGAPAAPLWDALADAGFLELLAPEAAGGAGLTLAEAFPVFTALGRHAVPAPVAQSLAARALLAPHGVAVPAGMVTLAPALRAEGEGGYCAQTPFGMLAGHVLADAGSDLVLLDCAAAERVAAGVHGSQCATLRWARAEPLLRLPGAGGGVQAFGAALHAALLAGAMSRVFELTLQYGNDRAQFGKSIGKFQAIQHQLAVMAEHVAAAGTAAELAFRGDRPVPAMLGAAIAKARTSEAVGVVAASAHAVHGAIGVTEEYDLQLLTRRLHEWRMAHGSEAYWHRFVGEALLAWRGSASDFARQAA